MKKNIFGLVLGVIFGVIMSKSEAISWFRIQEMFRFHSFHMYGIIFSALFVGIIIIYLLKKLNVNTMDGQVISIPNKKMSVQRYIYGGTIFGLGWALIGACPGPIFVLIGHGFYSLFVVLGSALLGTVVYGILRSYLPH